ncbi:MAG TPA: adenylate/guanylate cyclase domain-containing protein [Blastocatellia bacterium]|nr:adenylate/guanylate cyclase domain-containing protein [Blastocatellia bacterium]
MSSAAYPSPREPAGQTAIAQTPVQSQPLSALEIAHVMSIEIVDYSKLPMDQQTRLLGRLMRIVSETVEFRRWQSSDQLISVPGDEGMTLVFFGDPVAPARCATEIGRALQSYPEMKVRIGIHSGPVYRMTSIDARSSVSGEGIKTAQRIMEIGDAGHILVSKSVADTLNHLGTWSKCLYDLGERELTPGARLQLFNLWTGEVGNPERPCEFPATLPTTSAAAVGVATAAPVLSAAAARVAATTSKKRIMVIAVLSVLAAVAGIAGFMILTSNPAPAPAPSAEKPLTTTEFAEIFTSLDQWKAPSSWSFAKQRLQIENEPILGYAREVNVGDFDMSFHLTLINDGGAAWALRVKDPNNYYLFYLSGPGGMNDKNAFFTYLVRDGKQLQKKADNLVVTLKAGGQYHIDINVTNDLITQTITSDNLDDEDPGVKKPLGQLRDDTYHTGSIGFRTLGAEKFVVWGLFVRPPNVTTPD